jgi:MoaA/NifB/PqqE/SkfB family radical SAM enzyme
MYEADGIRRVHLEITSRCNARCPQCPRNLNGGPVNPNLPLTELRLEDIRVIFPADFVRQLSLMYMCGNYGDAIVARDTLEVFRYFRAINGSMRLKLHTNGSGRDHNWWAALAHTIDTCVFAIDGLRDTNHIYRRGTSWDKIISSAQSFIAAGGKAEWNFLVFRHNEHQVNEARQLSEKLRFTRFTLKRSNRFFAAGKLAERFPVMNADHATEYYLQAPSALRLQNEAVLELAATTGSYQDYLDYLASTPIECKAEQQQMIYVSAEGLVLPCCWVGGFYRPQADGCGSEIEELLRKLPDGRGSIDGRLHPITEIVSSLLFRELIPGGWTPNSPQRLQVCARNCGACDIVNGQYLR